MSIAEEGKAYALESMQFWTKTIGDFATSPGVQSLAIEGLKAAAERYEFWLKHEKAKAEALTRDAA